MSIKLEEFLPDINSYLETNHKDSVSSRGLEILIDQIVVKTGLENETASVLVGLFFQEIRNSIFKNKTVTLRGLGKFYISSPSSKTTKTKVFIGFKPSKKLIKMMNNE